MKGGLPSCRQALGGGRWLRVLGALRWEELSHWQGLAGTRGQLSAEGGWTVLDVGGKGSPRSGAGAGLEEEGLGEVASQKCRRWGWLAQGFKSHAPSVLNALTAPSKPSSRPLYDPSATNGPVLGV